MKMTFCLVILLSAGLLPEIVRAEGREDELAIRQVNAAGDAEAPLRMGDIFTVGAFEDDPALRGLSYSALGWDLDATADPSRTVTITAESGTLVDGVFTPDSASEIVVMSARSGEGEFDWLNSGALQKLYRLTHTVRKNGAIDAKGTLYGFLDFSHCGVRASQAEVERAVSQPPAVCVMTVDQDGENPWQPIDFSLAGVGLVTDGALSQGVQTTTAFAFEGRGTLYCEYRLTGGALSVAADDEEAELISSPTAGWVARTWTFDGTGSHTVVFTYTASGDGATAGLRHARWLEDERFASVGAAKGDVRVDLREGVRTAKYLSEVLPFEYSSTNWIGNVVNVSAESVAKVTVVQLTGAADADVTTWTEEVPNTKKDLIKKTGEGSVKWKARKGVWKATFDILNGDKSIHREEVLFDLRDSRCAGLVLILS